MPEMTIRQAAAALGTSVDTIRRRIRRAELASRRDERGWIMVQLPDAQGSASPMQTQVLPNADAQGEPTADLVQRLTDENRWLRDQLDKAAEERAELRRLLAGAMQALPSPASAEEPPSPATPATKPRAASERPVARRRSPRWFDRLLGRWQA